MSEIDDPELIKAIEDFLLQGREIDSKEEYIPLSMVREDLRDSVLRMSTQGLELNDFLNQVQGISMNTVSREQAVIETAELADLARNTAKIVLASGISDRDHGGVYLSWRPTSPFRAFVVGLSGNAVPDFLSTKVILFENYLSGNIKDDRPRLAEALGVDGERPTGLLQISSHIGTITDPQTRLVMEHAVSTFPEAPQLTQFSYTYYYFFGSRMGKVVNLPPILLGKRVIEDEIDLFPSCALSDITAGDLAIARIGLLAVERGLVSQLA